MRHLLKIMIALTLLCTLAIGQISDPAAIDFALVKLRPDDDRLVLRVPGYFMYGNVVGDATLSATPDITLDSLVILTDYHERYWTVKVMARTTAALVTLEMREFGNNASRGKFIDTFTHTGGSQFWTDSLFKSVPGHTFDFSVCFNDTGSIDVDDEFRIYFSQTRLAQGSDLAALGTYSLPNTDTLTILTWDTLLTPADTVYTLALPADMGYLSLYIDQYPKVSTGISMFGVGLQTKIDDGPWAFPLSNNRSIVEVLVDSAAVDSGVVTERMNNVPGDSVRYAIWSKSAWDVILRKIRALWRD